MTKRPISAALERALAHHNELPVRSVEIPEWGRDGEPFVVYWRPWTAYEKRRIYGAVGMRDEYDIACRVIEQKALDAEGKRLFQEGEGKDLVRGAHDKVVAFLAQVIVNDRDADGDAEDGPSDDRSAALMGSEEAVKAAAKN